MDLRILEQPPIRWIRHIVPVVIRKNILYTGFGGWDRFRQNTGRRTVRRGDLRVTTWKQIPPTNVQREVVHAFIVADGNAASTNRLAVGAQPLLILCKINTMMRNVR